MAGYPGSGKSTLARQMADTLPAYCLSSDGVREKMFQSSRYDNRGDAAISPQRDQVYIHLGEIILDQLAQQEKVIVDATNLEAPKREIILTALFSQLSPQQICFVCVKTPYRVICGRMKQFDNQKRSTNETFFEAWQRVYNIFQQKKKQGLLSWPNYKNIDTISEKEMYAYLG